MIKIKQRWRCDGCGYGFTMIQILGSNTDEALMSLPANHIMYCNKGCKGIRLHRSESVNFTGSVLVVFNEVVV
jgi:hypothetical protein